MTAAASKSAAPIPRLLTGQKALVTGANSGIGQAVAIALGQAGADVVVNYVAGEGRAQEVVRAIAQHGVKAYAHLADVSDETQVRDMFSTMVQRLGTIDILVNNAGLQRDAAFEEMTLKQWNAVISVNLTGQFLCARAAIIEFLRRGVRPEVSSSAGKIICMSSGIAPGAIRTPINTAAWDTKAAYDALMRLVPYRRIGEPDDIGRAAVWLASDQADYVVGATLFLDGGMTLFPGFATGG